MLLRSIFLIRILWTFPDFRFLVLQNISGDLIVWKNKMFLKTCTPCFFMQIFVDALWQKGSKKTHKLTKQKKYRETNVFNTKHCCSFYFQPTSSLDKYFCSKVDSVFHEMLREAHSRLCFFKFLFLNLVLPVSFEFWKTEIVFINFCCRFFKVFKII
jgi:hypothetical protein